MSLREEMRKYEQITGESAEHVPIIKLGAFLDGYEMGIKVLEQSRGIPVTSRPMTKDEAVRILTDLKEDDSRFVLIGSDRKGALDMDEIINMTEKYYIYLVDTLTDVISDLDVEIGYGLSIDSLELIGKQKAYQDILNMIRDDYIRKFNGDDYEQR